MKLPKFKDGNRGGAALRGAPAKKGGFFGRLLNRARRALGGGSKGGSGGGSPAG